MPYEIKTTTGGKLLILRFTGEVLLWEIAVAAQEVDLLIDPMRPPCLLIDIRSADLFPDVEERSAWRRQRAVKSPLVDKVAYVTDHTQSETVEAMALEFINSGINVGVFLREFEALEWLL